MTTIEELQLQYGTVWEIIELGWDWAASRRKPITQAMYKAGFLQVLLARDLDALAERLGQQAALAEPVRVLNGVMIPRGHLSEGRPGSRPALTSSARRHH
jgi:hypothetical protein